MAAKKKRRVITKAMLAALQKEARERNYTFRAIGHFLFEFSQLEFSIRAVLFAKLKLPQNSFDLVISPFDFATLCNVTCKMSCLLDPEREADITSLYNQCRALNDERVRVAHGLWSHGPGGMVARHVARSSLTAKYHFEDPDELDRLAERAQHLLKSVMGFG